MSGKTKAIANGQWPLQIENCKLQNEEEHSRDWPWAVLLILHFAFFNGHFAFSVLNRRCLMLSKLLPGFLALSCFAGALALYAADDAKQPTPTTDKAKDSAQDIEQKLKEKLDAANKAANEAKPAAPMKKDDPRTDLPKLPAPAPGRIDQPDPRIIGIAPGGSAPKLRREGEFVLSRRGRLIRAEGGQLLFSFDADSDKSEEAPMFLMPCRLLENMEEMSQEHGDRTVFILSGQVFVYRGANYLLPTMMKPSIDRGNLKK